MDVAAQAAQPPSVADFLTFVKEVNGTVPGAASVTVTPLRPLPVPFTTGMVRHADAGRPSVAPQVPKTPLMELCDLTRQWSGGLAPPAATPEWRTFLSVEDRLGVRAQIRSAYAGLTLSHEALLDLVSSIDEELLHMAAPTRLDYFKRGLEFGSRVRLKRGQLAPERKDHEPNPDKPPDADSEDAAAASDTKKPRCDAV